LDEDGVFCVHRLDQPWTTVFREPETQAKSLAFSPQNDVLAVGLASGAVHLFDVRRASRLDAWDVDQGVGISALVFSRRSRMLAAGSERGIVVSWDLESRKERARWDSRTDRVDCLAWADQVSLLAMGGHDSSVWICDPRKPGQPTPLAGHLDSITGMAFSPDGRVLATVSYDQNIMLWDPSVCELRATLRGHTGTVHAVAFAPDGKTLATSSSDNTVRLWHAVTEDPLRVSSGPNTARVPH
jgi:WD40 repeat protein